MRNIRYEAVDSLVWVTTRQLVVCQEVDYCNNILHAEDPGPTWCERTVKVSTCGTFDILNAMLSRVLIMLVEFRFLTPYPISANKLVHTPHILLLCTIDQMFIGIPHSWKLY